MEELQLERKVHGYDLKQVMKTDRGYIYEKSYNGQLVSYEVFKRRVRKPVAIYGVEYPEQVVYPGDNLFGTGNAFDCRKLEEAVKRLNSFDTEEVTGVEEVGHDEEGEEVTNEINE
jgi:hypothetical protein